jgi:hypothetical protein
MIGFLSFGELVEVRNSLSILWKVISNIRSLIPMSLTPIIVLLGFQGKRQKGSMGA